MTTIEKHSVALGAHKPLNRPWDEVRRGDPRPEDRRHATSVSLEPVFWNGLRDIAIEREMSVSALIGEIDIARELPSRLSAVLRVVVCEYYAARVRAFKGLPKT